MQMIVYECLVGESYSLAVFTSPRGKGLFRWLETPVFLCVDPVCEALCFCQSYTEEGKR